MNLFRFLAGSLGAGALMISAPLAAQTPAAATPAVAAPATAATSATAAAAPPAAAPGGPIPIEDFAALPFLSDAQISPDGTKIAARVSNGAVSYIGPFDANWEYVLDRAVMTTAMNPGLGGGPLLDPRGEVLGVVSLNLNEIGRFSLAIPIYSGWTSDLVLASFLAAIAMGFLPSWGPRLASLPVVAAAGGGVRPRR